MERMVSRMAKRNRCLALVMAAAILFVMLTSAFFIAAEAGHDCIGDGCEICCQVNICRAVLKGLALIAIAAVFAAAACAALCAVFAAWQEQVRNFTLVSLKVKLSD